MTNKAAHDSTGWTNYCQACGRAYWAAYQSSGGKVRRMDWTNREQLHECHPAEETVTE